MIEFQTGIADPAAHACRLLRRAYRQQVRVALTAPEAVLAALDRDLWTADAHDFVPHVRWTGAAERAHVESRTPLWLLAGAYPHAMPGAPPVLVNVGAEVPADPAALARIIEIVGADADSVEAGRARWRDYARRGLRPVLQTAG